MEGKPYPEAKRKILIELSTADFIEFLEEVRDQAGKLFIQNQLLQRRVPGFRDGRAPFTRTVPQLITKLKSEQELTNPDSAIWNSFADVWMYWVKSHQELDNTLNAFDNGKDFDKDHNCIMPPNSELDIECFQFLLEASRNTAIHQEVIHRFYEYGYFNEDERIQNLINQVPSCAEIERREQLAGLPDKVDELFQAIDGLSRNIEDLNSRVSTMESADELEQKLTEQITKECQHFDTELQKLKQTTIGKHNQFDTQISSIESNSNQLVGLVRRINSLGMQLSKLSESVNSFEDKLSKVESVNRQEIDQLINQRVQDGIKQLDSRMRKRIKSFEMRIDEAEVAISKIKSKITDKSKISTQALEIGKRYGTRFRNEDARYSDEEDYLAVFRHGLRRFGITDSEEEAIAIHIAMKAFPALEVTDAQIMRVWNMVCGNHIHFTTIDVEMGWLGLQDWFPGLFAEECFKERLERADLEISIKKMLELGNMPWIIYLRNCDRSFPEIYLPRFLDWIGGLCSHIKVLLIRSSWANHCKINEDFYARVARLPEPQNQEPIEVQNLKPRDLVTLTEWTSWCLSNPEIDSQYDTHLDFLEELRSVVGNRGWQIPIEILREIQRYLRLSHNVLAKTRALDWALTLRLLPWIGNRHRLIDIIQNLVNESNQELSHFQEGLQVAREAGE